jgi:1-deoxy-D-xylulose-5-phosphate reductoisomerase
VRKNNDLKVAALTAGRNIRLLSEQIREFMPEMVSVSDEGLAKELKTMVRDIDVKISYGMDGLIEAATYMSAQTVVTAIVGMLGIRPTIEAIKAGKDIALANKETLVTAGHIIMPLAKEYNVRILPVDSEHSAIFQSINGEKHSQIEKILITASGGPFRGRTIEQMRDIKVEDALKHPNWSMGRKITIDSATMVNKGLEVMEAGWLFNVDLKDIQVVVHPQSVIHSMVQFVDGAVMAQLGSPDMRLPIQYALYYPDRKYLDSKRLDFFELKSMTFEAPDMDNFKGLALALRAAKRAGNIPTAFNAANEKAVALFLDEKIGFLEIPQIIEESMDKVRYIDNPSVDDILATESEVYEFIESRW